MATAQYDASVSVSSQNHSGSSSFIQNFNRSIKPISFEVRGSAFISKNPRQTPAAQDPLVMNSVVVNNRVEMNSNNNFSVTSYSNSSSVVNSPYGKINDLGPIGSFLPSSGRPSLGPKKILEENDSSSEESIMHLKLQNVKVEKLPEPKHPHNQKVPSKKD